jgi:hypothetical protein
MTVSISTKNALFYLLCILFMCSYMFRRNRYLREAYTNYVQTQRNTVVLQ